MISTTVKSLEKLTISGCGACFVVDNIREVLGSLQCGVFQTDDRSSMQLARLQYFDLIDRV